MDTIQLDLIFKNGCDFTREEERKIKRTLEGLESPLGYSYCDLLKGRGIVYGEKETKIMVKLSFPRFYFENNAYLITTYKECNYVQRHFVKQLKEHKFLNKIKAIRITRLDIPFTYIMEEGKEFYDYSNVFKILALTFTQKYKEVKAKSIVDTIEKREETIIYADTSDIGAYNMKVTIYNQQLNVQGKERINMNKTLRRYPDLPRRMRIEMSKRINRKKMLLEEFKKFQLFEEYLKKYKEEFDKVMFNKESLKKVNKDQVEQLSKILVKYKEKKGESFTYENFILKKKEKIYDYKILRDCIGLLDYKKKTKENAIKAIRKALMEEIEKDEGRFVMEVRDIVEDIADTIKKSFKGQRKKKVEKDEWEDSPF